jgi:membrane-bound serine protease (ClpP class)
MPGNLRDDILLILGDPTTAYLVLLSGIVLMVIEFLRPHRGVVGVPGAVLATMALYVLGRESFTALGISLLTWSIGLVLITLGGRSPAPPLFSGAVFTVGSAVLFAGPDKVHIVAASLGGLLMFFIHWLLRIAFAARMAKRHG